MEDGGSKITILYPRSSILDLSLAFVIFYNMLGQAPAQNLGRAFGNADAAQLAIPPLEWQLAHQSQAPVHLNRAIDYPAGHFGALDFCHIRQLTHVLATIMAPGALVNHETAGMKLHRRIGDHELDRLAIGQRPAEGGADF